MFIRGAYAFLLVWNVHHYWIENCFLWKFSKTIDRKLIVCFFSLMWNDERKCDWIYGKAAILLEEETKMWYLPKTQWLHNGGGADVRLPLALVVTRKLPYLVQIFSIKISRNERMTNATVLIPIFGVNFRFSSVNWTLGHCILLRVCNQPPTSANEDFQNNFLYHSVKKYIICNNQNISQIFRLVVKQWRK